MPFMFSCIVRGRRRSLKLKEGSWYSEEERNENVQFCFYPALIFSLGLEGGVFCLCASSHDSPILVVVYHGGNLGIARYMFLSWESRKEDYRRLFFFYIPPRRTE